MQENRFLLFPNHLRLLYSNPKSFALLLNIHVARHTFAVLALNKGLTMSVVSRLLGHGSTDVTEKVYAKFLPETLASEVEKIKVNILPEF